MTLVVEHFAGELPAAFREADVAEACLAFGSVEEAVRQSIDLSFSSYSVKWRGKVLALWGYAPVSISGETCWVWLLSTPDIEEAPVAFALASSRVCSQLNETYPILMVLVDPRYEKAKTWLSWLGFEDVGTLGPFLQMRKVRDGYAH